MRAFLFIAILASSSAIPWSPESALERGKELNAALLMLVQDSVAPTLLSGADRLYAAISAVGRPDQERPFRTQIAERGDIITTVEAAGTLNALQIVEVGAQVSGLVSELHADFNSVVSKGQVIARVEPEMYEARVAQAQAELEMAHAQVVVQKAQISRAAAEVEDAYARHASAGALSRRAQFVLADAEAEMERKRTLAERGVISAGEWLRTKSAVDSAKASSEAIGADETAQAAAIRAAEAAHRMAEAQLDNILAQVRQREAVLRQAQIDLERTYIRAPVSGTVVNRAVSGGQALSTGLQSPVLFTIAQDLTQMHVEASVVEADVSRFAVGQDVIFNVDAYSGRSFTGVVKQIRKAPEIVQNVVTYTIVVSANNPDERLLPGMTANLQVVTATRAEVLKVPNSALRYGKMVRPPAEPTRVASAAPVESVAPDPMNGGVYILRADGTASFLPLWLGMSDGRMTEVIAGDLVEGQPVIVGSGTDPAEVRDGSSSLVRFRLR